MKDFELNDVFNKEQKSYYYNDNDNSININEKE